MKRCAVTYLGSGDTARMTMLTYLLSFQTLRCCIPVKLTPRRLSYCMLLFTCSCDLCCDLHMPQWWWWYYMCLRSEILAQFCTMFCMVGQVWHGHHVCDHGSQLCRLTWPNGCQQAPHVPGHRQAFMSKPSLHAIPFICFFVLLFCSDVIGDASTPCFVPCRLMPAFSSDEESGNSAESEDNAAGKHVCAEGDTGRANVKAAQAGPDRGSMAMKAAHRCEERVMAQVPEHILNGNQGSRHSPSAKQNALRKLASRHESQPFLDKPASVKSHHVHTIADKDVAKKRRLLLRADKENPARDADDEMIDLEDF
eukprot:361935-Chlamydomonas_euryale.AAC.2